MYKKNVKKYVLMMAALLLVCVVSVAGTLAYLSATTEAVTNTFAIGDLFDNGDDNDQNDGKFELKEHLATYAGNGTYTLDLSKEIPGKIGENNVSGNTYDKILPGVNIPKDPFVRISNLQVDAYLFIEVVDTTSPKLTYTLDGVWKKTNYKGANGGTVYVYENNGSSVVAANSSATYEFKILRNDTMVVASDYAGTTSDEKLVFYGYMIQKAGINSVDVAAEELGIKAKAPASGQ